jgi:hypothetical protein
MRAPLVESKPDPGRVPASRKRDRHEIEADRAADRFARTPQGPMSESCACGGGCPRCAGGLAANLSPVATGGSVAFVASAEAGAGRGLPEPSRGRLERHFGADLGGVRVHADDGAARLSERQGARAFAYGRDIFLPPAEFRPGTTSGDRLLAHEVAHTIQQAKGAPTIQRDEKEGESKGGAAKIGAGAMLGLPTGAHVVVARSMSDFLFNLLSSNAPDVATSLTAVSGKQATVSTASEDLVELGFDQPVTLPAVDKTPARTLHALTIRLRRTAAGHFDFEIAGRDGEKGGVATLYSEADLTARAEGGAYVLSAGTEAHLRLTSASSPTGAANIEAYTAPYLVGQPAIVKKMAPSRIGLISVTGLPSAPDGGKEQKEAVKRILDRAAASRVQPRQTFTLGAGIVGGFGLHPLLRSSWRYGFEPSAKASNLLQVPLQVDLFYAPSSSVIGAVSSGVGTSLSSLKIPINVRLTAGVGGGSVEKTEGQSVAVFGPTVGAGLGYERGWFRMELRWDQLFNVLPGEERPGGIPTGSLNVGGSF